MKTKWTSALLLTSALLTGGFFSTSALAQAAPPADSAQVQQSVAQGTNRISINTATAEELARNSVVSGRKKHSGLWSTARKTDHLLLRNN